DDMQSVVVTGTARGRSKLNAPFAISTLNEGQLQRDASTSTVDMLKRVPGFSVEASGGQGGGQNIYARGLPGGGRYY
ncbi:TonB-dependent receptor plug domain-containing protein, partial [Pseudomonas sp. RTS4]|uniref:TonB-dependent receptor plug domain-containing protein n=1 Tax=Pseudomonas sp. RTS4 TaxID=3048644 RepID=UPI002B222517